MNKTLKTNYLARDFASIKTELKNYAKRYYGDSMADLSEANINSFMIDAASYVGDILSYYLDYQSNESFLATSIEPGNIFNIAKSLGYKTKDTSTTVGKVAVYMLIPDNGSGSPDFSKSPTILKGTELQSIDNNKYIITEDVKIDEYTVGSNAVVARTNDVGRPLYWAVKLYAPIISGLLNTTQISVSNFVKFNKIYLNDFSITEIISITDSENNIYYEVPNLSQNMVYVSYFNPETDPKYILKPVSAQRRFVFDYDVNLPYVMFGGKQYRPDEDLTINPIVEPTKFVLNKYNNDYLQDDFFEPNKLTNGDNYGIGPDNTTLTIVYRINSSTNNNANINDIRTISSLKTSFQDINLSQNTKNTILSSIQIINEEEITGDNVEISTDELKNLAGSIYASQNRAVTAKDYETLTYMMPQKYGSIKRVKAERDPTSRKNNINLYVVCNDKFNFLTKSNTKIKENLKTWLSEYKILTDTVDILDAKIINFGIDYVIKVDPNSDKLETLDKVNTRLRSLYTMKPQIGESFNVLDVYREIRKVKEVLDIIDVKVKNITSAGYSSIPFNINQNYTSDGNLIKIPKNVIYEIKFIDKDIVGKSI